MTEALAPAHERAEVVVARLGELFEIDRAAGTNRPGLGSGEQRAHDMVAGWMREAGLEVEVDRAGNLFGRLRGREPDVPEVWSGSHLDTPPDGGAFDGALGVLAALEAAAAIGATGGARRTIAAVAFRLEEGPRFGRGVFGSRAVVGQLEPDEGDLLDPEGITLAEAFAALGFGELPSSGWADPPPTCFVETHIEQGPALAAQGATLGIVTSIAGMAGIEVVFTGRRGHAGTVPMPLRADAVAAAAAFVTALHEAARGVPGGVATVGSVEVTPGASNTTPGRAALFADVRAPGAEGLERLVGAVGTCAGEAAAATGCTAEVVPRWRYEPEPMDDRVRDTLRRAVSSLGLDPVDIASGAGHDAAILAAAGIPSGMLFVRSDAGGVSHAPEEHTGTDAVAACLAALAPALRELAA